MPFISTEKSRIDLDKLVSFLQNDSYWAKSRSREQIETSIANSLCFGIYDEADNMIGFGRVVSDYGVFAYLADIYIDKDERGKGYGKMLMQEILAHPDLQLVHRWMLGTLDAHGLYLPYGFSEVKDPSRWMEFLPKGSEL